MDILFILVLGLTGLAEDRGAFAGANAKQVDELEAKLGKFEEKVAAHDELIKNQRSLIDVLIAQNLQLHDKLNEVAFTASYTAEKNRSSEKMEDKSILAPSSVNKTGQLHGSIKRKRTRMVRAVEDHVAFSSYLNKELHNLGPSQTIIFPEMLLNDGNAYNAHTGIFTVPEDGVYIFFVVAEDYHINRIYLHLYVDSIITSTILGYPRNLGEHSMGTNVVILRLRRGQTVWVGTDAEEVGDMLQGGATTFSGVLLYP